MDMKPEEIVASYREAKNKNAQVRVLADLNACKPNDIINVLIEGGIEIQKKPRKNPEKKTTKPISIDYDRMKELYDKHLTDTEIAHEMKCGLSTVSRWRANEGLPFNKQSVIRDSEPKELADFVKVDEQTPEEPCKTVEMPTGWYEELTERQAELIKAYRIVLKDVMSNQF